jgi:hypothetical protein
MDAPGTRTLGSGQRAAADDLVRDLRRIFGGALTSVVAYWSAAPDDDDERLHMLVLVERLTFEDLAACVPLVEGWHRRGLAAPFILARDEFRRSLDVFPLEYGEIIRQHVLVAGEPPFAGASVDDADVRRACELQAKSHLIHLREGFLERGMESRWVAGLIAASVPSFRVLLRNIARLSAANGPTPASDDELAAWVQRHTGVDASVIHGVLRSGNTNAIADPTALLSRYIAASERIWEYVDSWRAR